MNRRRTHKVHRKTRIFGGSQVARRSCLRCDKLFRSIGRGNRICPVCGRRPSEEHSRSVRVHHSKHGECER